MFLVVQKEMSRQFALNFISCWCVTGVLTSMVLFLIYTFPNYSSSAKNSGDFSLHDDHPSFLQHSTSFRLFLLRSNFGVAITTTATYFLLLSKRLED